MSTKIFLKEYADGCIGMIPVFDTIDNALKEGDRYTSIKMNRHINMSLDIFTLFIIAILEGTMHFLFDILFFDYKIYIKKCKE